MSICYDCVRFTLTSDRRDGRQKPENHGASVVHAYSGDILEVLIRLVKGE